MTIRCSKSIPLLPCEKLAPEPSPSLHLAFEGSAGTAPSRRRGAPFQLSQK